MAGTSAAPGDVNRAGLVVFGGLPGTGKSMAAKVIARRTGSLFLRIDVIEQTMRDALDLPEDIQDSGYRVAYALAAANLALGHTVLADSVNPIELTRQCWREVASQAGADLLTVEFVCTDSDEHRRRVEGRRAEIAGLTLPSWPEVVARHYEPWPTVDLVIDTAKLSAEQAADAVIAEMKARWA